MTSSDVETGILSVKLDKTGIKNNNEFKKLTFAENNDIDRQPRRKWADAKKPSELQRKKSWKLIDGEIDEMYWSPNDGCRKWFKRFLTMGNILVIIASIGILFSASYLCFSR